ncbi:hypothetical protein GPECTOR_11g31 [Gonium pectorale]|uniref:Clusterin-associated protein 1 n=1 Tax=Gonium pectorale TaxID=33097 RepID=A0A150GPZ3_GONPE|nr:hypothetical protein GPECTOR_11g31 [Gonium pectorale]|eukprot:KXZ51874.1 hypothetical protein GPECTOR_11g31 [Gonium pectorale]
MSFRELRSYTEVMKALGYPRLISMENFRTPNFELVADCLYWLLHRYYPGVEIADDISTEADRVKFLQSVAQVMLTKARMKLNIKRLYAADGNAVKELLKLATLLYKATSKAGDTDNDDAGEIIDINASLKGFNPKDIKGAASEIIKAGAALYDALGQEPELREHRARAVAGHVDTDFVERSIREAIAQVEDNIRALENQMEDLERNEKTLDNKIEKKKQELERQEKRLSTLQSVRPAYMDEYERLQGELNTLYQSYLDKFRNLEFLENELEAYYIAEQDKMEAQERRLKKMQKRLKEEELRILRGEQEVDETNMNFDDDDDDESEQEGEEGEEGDDDEGGGYHGSKATMRRGPGGQGAGVGGAGGARQQGRGQQVMGNLEGDFEDEASIDEDDNTDGGDVSRAGSDSGGAAYAGGNGYANGYGGYDQGAYMNGGMDDDGQHFIQDDDEDDNNF